MWIDAVIIPTMLRFLVKKIMRNKIFPSILLLVLSFFIWFSFCCQLHGFSTPSPIVQLLIKVAIRWAGEL